jgi:signal transduction histidine kinase/CheY-like chemotaxis protein|nr:response regulator [Kofleriaceae bacterium]
MAATILVADDEPAVREMLFGELSGRGFEVVVAGNSREALAAVSTTEFDVVLSDLRLMRLDCEQLVRLAPDTEIVIATEPRDLAWAIECVRDGAFDWVAKPFDLDDLTSTIARALERRQLRASTALYEASRAILDASSPERLPETIVQVAMKVMNADDVSLMLLGPGDRLYVAYSHGMPTALVNDARQELGERVAGMVAMSREPALIADALDHDARFKGIASHGRVRSSIVYPITAGERLVGVLNINRVAEARPFRKLDLDKAAVLASQILLALENARLVRQIATTQQLTTIGQVSSSVVHEINNPISYVLASEQHLRERLGELRAVCETIERGGSAEEVRLELARAGGTQMIADLAQAADDIRDGAGRVRDIMRDLRSLARNRESRPVVFELAAAIRSATRVVAAELRHKATVVTEFADGVMIAGSPGRVSQVLVNLLVNAGEAFGPSGHHVIDITTRRDGESVTIVVRDDGPGIAPEHLPRVFEPFFTTKSMKNNSGLGLSISRDIIRGQGGEIRVDSEPGRATTVTITLPCLTDAKAAAPSVPAQIAAPRRLNILFVDDERTILRGYTRRFSRDNDVVAAASGAEALQVLASRRDFDLVICDLSMPDTNGMDVYTWVAEHAPGLASKFVFATGGATQGDLEAFLRSVPNEVLEKPFELQAIQVLVERVRAKP